MQRKESATMPVLELASRLHAHYRLRTAEEFDVDLAVRHHAYARDVLARVRIIADPALQEIADRFEQARFPVKPAKPAQFSRQSRG